jgi:hypothetical protein
MSQRNRIPPGNQSVNFDFWRPNVDRALDVLMNQKLTSQKIGDLGQKKLLDTLFQPLLKASRCHRALRFGGRLS